MRAKPSAKPFYRIEMKWGSPEYRSQIPWSGIGWAKTKEKAWKRAGGWNSYFVSVRVVLVLQGRVLWEIPPPEEITPPEPS